MKVSHQVTGVKIINERIYIFLLGESNGGNMCIFKTTGIFSGFHSFKISLML